MFVLNCREPLLPWNKNFQVSFFVLESDWKKFLRPLPTFIRLRCDNSVMNTMRTCRKTQVLAKSFHWLGWNFYSCVFRCKHCFLHFIVRLLKIVARTGFWTRVGWVKFFFAVWIFVSDVALFCTSNGQLITDVYKHRSWCPFIEQWYLLKDWGFCSEAFIVLEKVVGLLNFCAENIISVRKPETHFWCELRAKWIFNKICLQLTWN